MRMLLLRVSLMLCHDAEDAIVLRRLWPLAAAAMICHATILSLIRRLITRAAMPPFYARRGSRHYAQQALCRARCRWRVRLAEE